MTPIKEAPVSALDCFNRFVDKRLRGEQVNIARYVSRCQLSSEKKKGLREDLLRAEVIIKWQEKVIRDERKQEQERLDFAAKLGQVRTDPSAVRGLFPDIPEELSRKLAELQG